MKYLLLMIGLVGVIGATKISSEKECTSESSKISLATMRLCDVKWKPMRDKWIADGKIEDIQAKNVIAILISYPLNESDPLKWITSFIITEPEFIKKVVSALERAERLSGEISALDKLQFVFDDNTGVRIDFYRHTSKPLCYGTTWKSKELYDVFDEMFGPPKIKPRVKPISPMEWEPMGKGTATQNKESR